ncbi:cysteine-rich RLK (RECEPTOR-like protein kinase) 8, partial [Striga hermonthica]
DLGQLKYILGLEFAHSETGINMCQRKYALDILTDTGFLGCKPACAPVDPTTKLQSCSDSDTLTDPTEYRKLI